MRVMIGTNVKTHPCANGRPYRQQIASDVYITKDYTTEDGGFGDGRVWFCLETRHFRRMHNGVWEAEFFHRYWWFPLPEFFRRFSVIEREFNVMSIDLSTARVFVNPGETDGTLNEEAWRGSAEEAVEWEKAQKAKTVAEREAKKKAVGEDERKE